MPVRLPEFVLAGMLGRFGFPRLPTGALAHLKYPVVIDARPFGDKTGFVHQYDEIATIRAFREQFPV